ncbi:hypothetical protein Zmor_013596 [Zophobas morio]|uniref:Uncharacterized protein n=1 Tax=Zophobas morio TaxID=2755281 RepID=A0AA38IFT5_9CUCU|nr:hypothetical protein Zmor_013596 [Zophobas morio]
MFFLNPYGDFQTLLKSGTQMKDNDANGLKDKVAKPRSSGWREIHMTALIHPFDMVEMSELLREYALFSSKRTSILHSLSLLQEIRVCLISPELFDDNDKTSKQAYIR